MTRRKKRIRITKSSIDRYLTQKATQRIAGKDNIIEDRRYPLLEQRGLGEIADASILYTDVGFADSILVSKPQMVVVNGTDQDELKRISDLYDKIAPFGNLREIRY